MKLKEISNYGYILIDLPTEYFQFRRTLVTTLQRRHANDRVSIKLVGDVLHIERLPGSILVLGAHTETFCDAFLLGCATGFEAASSL